MRMFIALAATAALFYCGYVVLDTPTSGVPILQVLAHTSDAALLQHAGGAVLALIVLILTAFRGGPRVENITESEVLNRAQAFIDEYTLKIERLSHKSGHAVVIAGNLTEMANRIAVLRSGNNGLLVNLGKVDAKLPELLRSVESLGVDLDGNDLVERADELLASYASVCERVEKLERLKVALPGMIERLKEMQQSVEKLENNETGILANVGQLRADLDDLLDSEGYGRIADIEAGNDDFDGDLDDEIQEVRTRVKEISEALEGLLAKRVEINEIAASVAELGRQVTPEPRSVGAAAG